MACYLAALGYTVTKPSVPAISQNLADWLAAHDLTYGLSSYGLGNTTTLASGETVNVRSVSWENTEVAGGPRSSTSPGTTAACTTRTSWC